jgi:carboxypeptidase C (cathepsin A)
LSNEAIDGPRRFVTIHKGVFGGKAVTYTATVAETIVMDPAGKPAASAFTTAFTVPPLKAAAPRPVIFIFTGGPGGGSALLMFGAFGPKRLTSLTSAAMADVNTPIADNSFTVLDVADLVFLDPPDTGFSRRQGDTFPRLFLSVDGDSFVMGQLIVHWLVANGRLGSSKFLAGESYGTLRAVALARDLGKATPKIDLDGLVLISQAITYNGPDSIAAERSRDVIGAIARIPDVAAAAWYHGKIDNTNQTVEQAVTKAQAFARTQYAQALLLGNRLDDVQRKQVAQRLSELTGISTDYYLSHDLRIRDYRHELLRSEGKALAQFDGRETEAVADVPQDRDRDWDSAFAGVSRNMEVYAARDLGVKGLGNYVCVVHDPYGYEEGWTYVVAPKPMLDVVLTQDMKESPKLRLLVPSGIFDTTSSMGATTFMFSQLDIPAERVVLTYYAGGHMVYSDREGLEKFMNDVRVFVSGHNPSSAFPQVATPKQP